MCHITSDVPSNNNSLIHVISDIEQMILPEFATHMYRVRGLLSQFRLIHYFFSFSESSKC